MCNLNVLNITLDENIFCQVLSVGTLSVAKTFMYCYSGTLQDFLA